MIDEKRLIELIAKAEVSPSLEQTDKPSAQEFQEAAAEMIGAMGPAKASETIAELSYRQITEEAPIDDLTGVFMPSDGMFSLNDGPVYERWGSPILYWIGDESQHIRLHQTKPTRNEFTMTFDSIYVYFNYNVDLLAAGKFGSFSEQLNKARSQFIGGANMLMWKALSDAIGTTGGNYATGTLSVATLKTAIDYVEDNSEAGPKATFGRRSTLSALGNMTASSIGSNIASDSIKNEAWNKYVLGGYLGVPLVGLRKGLINLSKSKQIGAGFSGFESIPTGEVFVIPYDDYGRFAEQGPLQIMESRDAGERNYEYSAGRRMGVVIFDAGNACYKYVAT